MGKCVSKHPSAITIASAEYLTSNNKIFIEKYTDSITIKNENTNSDNSIYINSEYIPVSTTTEADILTIKPSTTVTTEKNYKNNSKNDKNLCNNTIVIEDYKNKKAKRQQSQQQKPHQNNNNNKNNSNKNKKRRKFLNKNEKSQEIVVANRNIVKNLTSQISKFTIAHSCINPTTTEITTATETDYVKDNTIDFQNKENVNVDNDFNITHAATTNLTKTIVESDFDRIKRFDSQKLLQKKHINNDNTTKNNNNNTTIEIFNNSNNDDVDNQYENHTDDTRTKTQPALFCSNLQFNKKLKILSQVKENIENQDKCNIKNFNNHYYNSIKNSASSGGNGNGNSIYFSAKKISCLSKNESQDSLDTTDGILKSLNTKKLHYNKIDNNNKNDNNYQNDKENIVLENEKLNELERHEKEVIKKNNFSLHNEGQTESKKKSKNIGPDTKGTAMSFGFRKKLNNTPKKQKFLKDKHIKDNCNNSDNVATDGTIITNPVLKDDLNNFHDKNGNSDTIDATTNVTATQQKFNSTINKNTFDKNEATWATHRTATQLSQNKEHISLMGGGNGNGSGGGGGSGNNTNNRNRFGFRSANIIRPASTGIPAPSIMTELQDNTNNNNNNNNNNTVTVKRRSKSASGVSSSRENSYNSDNEKNNKNNSGVGGIGNVAGGNITTKRSTLVNRNSDQQQQQQKVVNEVRFAENPKINYITSIHDIDDEYNSRPHWKQQNDIRTSGRSGGMTSEMLRNQFFNSGCNAPMSSGMMNRHGNMMNQNQIITTGMHTNVIVKPKPIMTTSTVTACKYTLHTASLPKPQYPVPISLTTTAPSSSSSASMDTKSAKQMVNNNRKGVFGPRDISTDSGLSSMDNTIDCSNASRSSVLRSISSTKASASGTSSNGGSPKKLSKNRPRNLEMVISGRHKFEVRDLDALSSCDNVEQLALPKLPSIFSSENQQLAPLSGLVRSNTILSRDSASTTQESTPEDMRKSSRTNSESDSVNEEKLFRDRSTAEKDTNKNSTIGLTSSKNSSPASSRASWCQAGESLAIKDCSSLSISSSDDSKDNHLGKTFTIQTEEISSITFDEKPSIFSSLTDSSAIFQKVSKNYALNNNDENIVDNKFDFLISDFEAQSKKNQNEGLNLQDQQFERPKTITKDVGDPIKFAEMAAAVSDVLLDDETSPTDSLVSSTESEEAMLKKTKKKTNEELPEKDIDEISPELDPCSPLSPGTPTHASNSLSLSDIGKDFLIDDEIADQPALLFSDKKNDTIEAGQHTTNSMTDTTPTLMESIGNNAASQRSTKSNSKSRNLMQAAIELSLRTPISLRKATMLSKAESWDTLSPCESIASDDLMMDFETSSMDSIDRVSQSIKSVNASALKAFDDAELLAEFETKGDEMIREWNNILRVHRTGKDSIISHLPARATRLLNRSRLQQQTQLGSTAGSDSPKSNDSFNLNRKHTSSSRTSSAHLSNREINSSSDDLLLYDKSFRNSMIQDVLYFKKQLLRLRRILQEDEECLQRTDTLNPFEVNNGQFFASPVHGTTAASTGGTTPSKNQISSHNQQNQSKNNHGGSGNSISSNHSDLLAQQYFIGSGGSDNEKNFGNSLQSLTSLDDPIQELADLRRQVVYLQSQVDDRERTIRFQKNLIEKLENESEKSLLNPSSAAALEKEVVNTATQTERVRPLSIGQEGLSRSKPEYTSYTINIPNSGSSTTTTTTEIISPSVTGINFFNSNNNHHSTSRRHTVISTTFTNLSNNHNSTTPTSITNNNNNNNNSINNNNNNNNSNNINNNNYRRASIPWEKLIYKPVKTTLIGEPISTINYSNINNNNIKNVNGINNNGNNNIEKNNSPITPTILKTTTTIISSQIDNNNKKNLLNNGDSKYYQNEENDKINENLISYGNNDVKNGKCDQLQQQQQQYQQKQPHQSHDLQDKQHSTNLLSSLMNNVSLNGNSLKNDGNNTTILNRNSIQNGANYSIDKINPINNSNKTNNNSNSNGMKCNSENHHNGNTRNSKLNNLKYNFINSTNNKNGSNYNDSNINNNNNNNCFDVIVTQKNTNKPTSNNGSVTTIV